MEINPDYKYYKYSMTSRFSSIISSALHCRPDRGGINAMFPLGAAQEAIARSAAPKAIALFAFEGIYLVANHKSALAEWLNSDRFIESGRCKCLTAPI
jgi:hypothetical protein